MQRFSPGDRIVLRERWEGRIWAAYPAIAVEDREDRFANHLPAGVEIHEAVAEDGSVLRIPAPRWSLRPTRTSSHRVLAFAFPDTRYAVLLLWDGATDEFLGYYVNVETSLGRTSVGVDYVDHLLDATIAPDRSSWAWKDEDELAEAVARGIYTDDDASAFHDAAEEGVRHVLEGRAPFDVDRTTWRPDPSWPRPELLEGWDRI